MKRTDSKRTHPIVTLCIGLGVGALVGILLAPKSGEETRDDIVDGVTDGIEEIRSRSAMVARGARCSVNEAKERLIDALEAGTEAYREAKKSAR
jgi:gas vesicle protein